MAESPKDPDQSMEDILQSIKRIIADEGDPAPTIPGSDVLELTELLAEDVAVSAPAEVIDEPAPVVATMSIDEIFADSPAQPAAPEPEPEPEPEPQAFVAPEPVEPQVPSITPEPEPAPVQDEEKLMSDDTLAASAAALHSLAHKPQPIHLQEGPSFRSGVTVEDLVVEALKPMLKDWLDNNLPALVRSLVEKEIRRLSA